MHIMSTMIDVDGQELEYEAITESHLDKPMNRLFASNVSTVPVVEDQGFESESLIKVHRFPSEEDTTADRSTTGTYSRSAADLLTPRAKGVYLQYVKDSDDNLLVDGYFRQNMPNHLLPLQVNRIIASYYLKTYSARNLHKKITALRMISCFCLCQ